MEHADPQKSIKKGPTVNLDCRMYEELLPEPKTCVMVNVRQITDVGTYVTLLEYNNIEGRNPHLFRNDFIIRINKKTSSKYC
jgi:hypothetical protein